MPAIVPVSKDYQRPPGMDVHSSVPLTNISMAYVQDQDDFVAHRVFQMISVQKQFDDYYVFGRGDWSRNQVRPRAEDTETVSLGFSVSKDNYRCTVRGAHYPIADQTDRNADTQINLMMSGTAFLTEQALIERERNFVNTFMKDGVWTFSVNGGGSATNYGTLNLKATGGGSVGYWSNYDTSDPLRDVDAMRQAIKLETGKTANVLVLSRRVYDVLKRHPDLLALINRGQTTGIAQVTRQVMAANFEVDEILVLDSSYNDSIAGRSDDFKFIGDKDALLIHRPASPGLMIPAAGYTFAWTGYTGATNDAGILMRTLRMESRRSTWIEVESAYDMKVTGASLGCFIDGIVQ